VAAQVPAWSTLHPWRQRRIARVSAVPRDESGRRLMPMDYSGLALPKSSTRLARAMSRKAARLLDAKKLRIWAHEVKERDHWKDRKTGVRVRRTRDLDPLRAEAHHIEPRDNPDTRYDVRNGITLALYSHELVTRHHYRIEGTVWFRKNGCRYIDGTYPVIFVRT
jgi:hypothetical protein